MVFLGNRYNSFRPILTYFLDMDSVIKAIQQLLKNASVQAGSPLYGIKKVFYWDPITIAATSLPALAIQPVNTEYIQRGSQYDQKRHSIEIRLIYNVKSFFSETPDIEKIRSVEDSINKIEKSTNFETINYSVCGTIEKNPTLPFDAVNTCELAKIKNVSYSFSESRGFPSYEVVVTVEADVIWNR